MKDASDYDPSVCFQCGMPASDFLRIASPWVIISSPSVEPNAAGDVVETGHDFLPWCGRCHTPGVALYGMAVLAPKSGAPAPGPQCKHCGEPPCVGSELCARHVEQWAKLRGLVTTLALPPLWHSDVREYRKRNVSVRCDDGVWRLVHEMFITSDRIDMVLRGVAGDLVELSFATGDDVPEWRVGVP